MLKEFQIMSLKFLILIIVSIKESIFLSLKLIIKEDWLYNVLKLIEGWRGFKCLSIP